MRTMMSMFLYLKKTEAIDGDCVGGTADVENDCEVTGMPADGVYDVHALAHVGIRDGVGHKLAAGTSIWP